MKKMTRRLLALLMVFCLCVPMTAMAANTYYLEITIEEEANPSKIVKSETAGYLLESEVLDPLVVATVNERYVDGSLERVFASPAMRDIMLEGMKAYEDKTHDNGAAWELYLAKYYDKVSNLDAGKDLKALMIDFDTTIGDLELNEKYQMKFKNEVRTDPKYGTVYIVSVTRKTYTSTGGSDISHDCPAAAYSDVDTNLWYHAAIDYALTNGIMNGIGGGKFDPDGVTTRAMIVTILWRLEKQPAVTAENTFEDVENDTWYTNAVIWANAEGIVNGYGNGKFGPMDVITREQFATILHRYAQWKGYDVSVGEDTNILSYTDAFEISEWAIPAMQWACGAGVMNGAGDGTLNPKGSATRAQAAQLFLNFSTNVAEQ